MVRVQTALVSWHVDKAPLFSVDFHPSSNTATPNLYRMATGGADNCARLWDVRIGPDAKVAVDFVATLQRHEMAVNVVRWSPSGDRLATGSDDRVVLVWQADQGAGALESMALFGDETAALNREAWVARRRLRGHVGDVYDVSWAPDGEHLCSGSTDNTAIVWNAASQRCVQRLSDHAHYVQGVAWDPHDFYLASQSSDRSVRIYGRKPVRKNAADGGWADFKSTAIIDKTSWTEAGGGEATTITSGAPASDGDDGEQLTGRKRTRRNQRLFVDENNPSYFRRASWSPEGLLLVTPAGTVLSAARQSHKRRHDDNGSKADNDNNNDNVDDEEEEEGVDTEVPATFLFARGQWKKPLRQLTGPSKGTVLVRFCPVLFELRDPSRPPALDLGRPVRSVYAVGALDGSVTIYDTEHETPVMMCSGLHFAALTDLSWSPDGRLLAVSSADGFCSFVQFDEGELGVVAARSEWPVPVVTRQSASNGLKSVALPGDATDADNNINNNNGNGNATTTHATDIDVDPESIEAVSAAAMQDRSQQRLDAFAASTADSLVFVPVEIVACADATGKDDAAPTPSSNLKPSVNLSDADTDFPVGFSGDPNTSLVHATTKPMTMPAAKATPLSQALRPASTAPPSLDKKRPPPRIPAELRAESDTADADEDEPLPQIKGQASLMGMFGKKPRVVPAAGAPATPSTATATAPASPTVDEEPVQQIKGQASLAGMFAGRVVKKRRVVPTPVASVTPGAAATTPSGDSAAHRGSPTVAATKTDRLHDSPLMRKGVVTEVRSPPQQQQQQHGAAHTPAAASTTSSGSSTGGGAKRRVTPSLVSHQSTSLLG